MCINKEKSGNKINNYIGYLFYKYKYEIYMYF